MLYYVYVILIYDCTYVRSIMYYVVRSIMYYVVRSIMYYVVAISVLLDMSC